MSDMTIGKVAEAVGVGVETTRFYERSGLIEQPLRPGVEDIASIRMRRCSGCSSFALGFPLREIAERLSLRTGHDTDAGEVRQRAIAKLQDVDRKIERLQHIRRGLMTPLDRFRGGGPLWCCSIIDAHRRVLCQ